MALINELKGIGDAIREKTGGTELIPLKEMADVIRSISGGESVEHSSITYNDDDTITLIETNGKVHTMVCTYEDGKLIGITYDDESVVLTYNGDVIENVVDTIVDMSKAPATSGGGADGTISRPFVEELEIELNVANYSAELA